LTQPALQVAEIEEIANKQVHKQNWASKKSNLKTGKDEHLEVNKPIVHSFAGVLHPSAHTSHLVPFQRGSQTQVLGMVHDPCWQPLRQIGVMQSDPVQPSSQMLQDIPCECALQEQLFGEIQLPLTQPEEQDASKAKKAFK
jgi:hypothetical protein